MKKKEELSRDELKNTFRLIKSPAVDTDSKPPRSKGKTKPRRTNRRPPDDLPPKAA